MSTWNKQPKEDEKEEELAKKKCLHFLRIGSSTWSFAPIYRIWCDADKSKRMFFRLCFVFFVCLFTFRLKCTHESEKLSKSERFFSVVYSHTPKNPHKCHKWCLAGLWLSVCVCVCWSCWLFMHLSELEMRISLIKWINFYGK